MRTIGVVGGIAWPGSIVYYRIINELIAQRMTNTAPHSAKLVLAQTDFATIEHNQREARWDIVADLVATQGRKLKAAGADFFLVACNTVHAVAHHIERAVGLPFLHIVDPTARRILDGGFNTVGLLGSRYTMTGGYFVGRLRQHSDVTVLIAEAAHQDNVHNALFEELAKGIYLDGTLEKFKVAIADLVERGAEAIVLGCTEFGLLVKAEDSPVPIIDTTVAHAEAAVDMALTNDTTPRTKQ
ncbi:amino acid racemase [Saccharopolyspora sp. K220]|uniref:aspartate/glutamate racemase family protein n=1 Tax=Saccharopolyspora soli TaxID=2926618 RepID=UPI001F5AC8FA|nr:amino acid racemase [Saccharopolyspora soli]MCI2419288.1 amino acid racemase [Saccharopolyspora soli]